MSETIPGYGPLPSPPVIDIAKLRSRIAMFLKSGAGDSGGRALLEQASLVLMRCEHQERGRDHGR